ncbi:MAG: winged helix-turn-helix domain-containing protein [Gemmataceae bacterium]|nr:winged helix-turn-helix domain-containing protein [Gemmataceae bacterium]
MAGRRPGGEGRHHRVGRVLEGPFREKTPDEVGLGEALWTRDAVATWAARERGVRRTRRVWGRWLEARGLTPQKPARRAYERDPAAVDRDSPAATRATAVLNVMVA